MRIPKSDIVNLLNMLKPGLSKKGIVEQATHFFFTGTHAATYNGKVAVSIPFATDFITSIDADDILKILSTISDDIINIKVEGTSILIFTQKRKWELKQVEDTYSDKIKIVLDDINSPGEWKKLPKDFIKGLEYCMFSASKDLNDELFPYVCANENYVWSTDRYRLSQYKMDEAVPERILIKALQIPDIIKYQLTGFKITDSWTHLKTEEKGVVYSTLKVSGSYALLELSKEKDLLSVTGQDIKIPDTLREVVLSTELFTEDQKDLDKNIIVKLEENSLTCTVSSGKGRTKQTVMVDYHDIPIEFDINPKFILDVLDMTHTLRVSKEEGRAKFVAEKFNHIFSLNIPKK